MIKLIEKLETQMYACLQGIMEADSLWLRERLLKKYYKLKKRLKEARE